METRRELKIFGASAESAQGKVIVPIGLTFVNVETGEEELHEFDTSVSPGDAGMVLALSSVTHVDASGKRVTDLNGLLYFYRQVMAQADYDRLCALLFERNDITIHIEILSDVILWLTGEFAARPTERPSGSSAGRSRTGKPSTGQPSLEAVTS